MKKQKNHYIKYTRAELESYTKHPESCVRKVTRVEPIRFAPTADFKSLILRILGRKIGKYDVKLDGIVLDFRNTKVLGTLSSVRQDSPFSLINVETNFYVFTPRKGAVVTGVMKYVNRGNMETIISVIIYRVFNVKITVRGKVKQEIEKNQEIQFRVADFHFDGVIPYIEGEIVSENIMEKTSSRKIFEDPVDSGISESSVTSEVLKDDPEAGSSGVQSFIKIKQERESSCDTTFESSRKSKKNKKRKNDKDDEEPPSAKRIKVDPERAKEVKREKSRVKQEMFTDIEDFLSESPLSSTQTLSTSTAEKKKDKKSKKKKRRRSDDFEDDDFETSLQNILNFAATK